LRKTLMRSLVCLIAILLAGLTASPSWARGGGGCLREGTSILTPRGPVAVEQLKAGDELWGTEDGEIHRARVVSLTKLEVPGYLEVKAGGDSMIVTPEHPVMVGRGVFRIAGRLQPGDPVVVDRHGKLEEVRINSVCPVPADRPAYNLLVNPGGTFISGGIAVHNKGCFLPDSLILRADGTEMPISTVQPGDMLLAFTTDGRIVKTRVHNVLHLEVNEHVILKTDRTTLNVTLEHPFYVGEGTFKTLDVLHPGDNVIAWDGRSLVPQRIESIEKVSGPVTVYNLQTDQPHTFFVGHVAVHNKGGCFALGTPITTPHGNVPIESLIPGDEILAMTDAGKLVPTRVKALLASRNEILRVETRRGSIEASPEHPFAERNGYFLPVGWLRNGDHILRWARGRMVADTVCKVSHVSAGALVFNLQVEEPHTFLAGGLLVHNKGGGCFPPGTLIRTPSGEVPIERLAHGDEIISPDTQGGLVTSRVESIYVTHDRLLRLDTKMGTLHTTSEHPIELADGRFEPAGDLKPGSSVALMADGQVRISEVSASSLGQTEAEVYNLSVSGPHTFVADGFIVHNKGGSYHRSSSSHHSSSSGSGSGSSDDGGAFFAGLMFFGILGTVLFVAYRKRKPGKKENLDFLYSPGMIAGKSARTAKLIEFLARQDPSVTPDLLRKLAESTFRKLQECWEKREYGPMKPLMMPSLYAQHTAQLGGLAQNREINRIEGLKIEKVDLVNVRYTEKPNQREFTALISASARDYYVDEATGKFLRGDKAPAKFQEFWTFQHQDNSWLLREVEQAGESDYLKDENFVEMLTDENIKGIYGETSGKEGAAAPWLEKGVALKANRIERMLNFLVQTDKIWDRTSMLERAREVFLSVYLARESGDPQRVPSQALFPEVAESLREQLAQWRKADVTAEFRNLCVRKVELIHVRNFSDRARDEFTVRISAHAQRIVRRGGRTVSEDAYVTDFEEYWTFGRLDERWKLKEALPPGEGKKRAASENIDEDSSAGQLQWYYRQTRAN
jgi:predicted lipid-binding transport protein (Tim44 family)